MTLTKALASFGTRLKAAARFLFSGGANWGAHWDGWRGGFNFRANVDPASSSLVSACVLWLGRTFPEAPITITAKKRDGTEDTLTDHPALQLLERPNPYYSGALLWQATIADMILGGNGYWVKLRSGARRPVQLWWVPQHLITPVWPADGSEFISGYAYQPFGLERVVYAPEDIVHFRMGLDPNNYRLGLSPLASLWREIYTDDEASQFSASLLRNLGVPGVVISPGSDGATLTPAAAEATKHAFMGRFGGDRRGEPLVFSDRTDIKVLSFSPEQMELSSLRRVPEERVAAVLGIPPGVVGFGAGLERNTFSNYEASKAAAYENTIIPLQRLLAAELEVQLLADFGNTAGLNVEFDYSKVRALQEDEGAKVEREMKMLTSGCQTLAECRKKFGLEADDSHDVYYVPTTVKVTLPDELTAPPEPVPAPLANPNDPNALPAGTQDTAPVTPKPPSRNGRALIGAGTA